jgi:hypothetical protein
VSDSLDTPGTPGTLAALLLKMRDAAECSDDAAMYTAYAAIVHRLGQLEGRAAVSQHGSYRDALAILNGTP